MTNSEIIEQTQTWLKTHHAVTRIWQHDASLWKSDADHQTIIQNALGWLTVAELVSRDVPHLLSFAHSLENEGYTDIVVLGMGGSSLISDVISHLFPSNPPALRLHILDSTHPVAIRQLTAALPLARTLFVFASKSGTTAEPSAYYRYFWQLLQQAGVRAGHHFIAITDPGTHLEALAKEQGFREIFLNPADIGGRYSALSWFGMLPAAVSGAPVDEILSQAQIMMKQCRQDNLSDNPGAALGTILGGFAKNGRDKITLLFPEEFSIFADWVEQLLAESTGKEGTGLIPIAHEPELPLNSYGSDRTFIAYLNPEHTDLSNRLDALEQAGHPVMRLALPDKKALGAECFRWEFATAIAGAVLNIDAFDQPNVQEGKDNTVATLATVKKTGHLPAVPDEKEEAPFLFSSAHIPSADTVQDTLTAWWNTHHDSDYVAIMAYMPMTDSTTQILQQMREILGTNGHLATTLGYGPRFLHSTGQLYKGGNNHGLFLQIVDNSGPAIKIPGEPYDFLTFIQAQALGDYFALTHHQRRV
ncbi:MAG: transaldolase, partial [Firmicutes bacterium]|nr:transaldolase [Bacillota bacterium]